jgi:hypothetical protein
VKIFISWSGSQSKGFASKLADWLPDVIQSVKPFVSVDDVDKGSRWANVVAKELEEASFGIICLTRGSLRSPWLNFEAGALSRRFTTADDVPVATLLLDMANPSDVPQPLGQVANRDDVLRLLRTINTATGEGINEARLIRHFDIFWPELESAITEVRDAQPEQAIPDAEPLKTDGKIDEMLSILRQLERSRAADTRPADTSSGGSSLDSAISKFIFDASMRQVAAGFGLLQPSIAWTETGYPVVTFAETLTAERQSEFVTHARELGFPNLLLRVGEAGASKQVDR